MNDIFIVFAFIGVLVVALFLIIGISLLLSLAIGDGSEERAFIRWLTVSIFYAISISLYFVSANMKGA